MAVTNPKDPHLNWLADCDGDVISFLTNLAFHDPDRRSDLTLVGIVIPLLGPEAHQRLGTSEERAELLRREDAITLALTPWQARWVSHTTWRGERTLYYAMRREKADMEAIRDAVTNELPEYSGVEVQAYAWAQYDEWLYPRESDFRWAYEADYIDKRVEEGDDIEIERRVDHWLYFPTKGGRDQARDESERLGYAVLSANDEPGDQDGHPWSLHLEHFSDVRVNTMFRVVTQLVELARSHGGFHDGWGAPVEAVS